jgi:hypothetical protein
MKLNTTSEFGRRRRGARELAFGQAVPPDYRIWLDIIENVRAILREHPGFDAAHVLVGEYLDAAQRSHAADRAAYRRKRIRKENTPFEDFLFSDARDDACFALSIIAIYRALGGDARASLLDDIYAIYQDGGWPCGMKGNRIVVFDPASISGWRNPERTNT